MVLPNAVEANTVRALLLKPALTSHFVCSFTPPESVINHLASNELIYNNSIMQELISLSCSDAYLPGSSLTTNQVSDDYHGVTERFAYRRLYDNQTDFTFYVDTGGRTFKSGYNIIWFFEKWMSYIVNEQFTTESNGGIEASNYFYRVRFPKYYRNDIRIYKFEKDYDLNETNKIGPGFGTKYKNDNSANDNKSILEYIFKDAYPINIASMPVTYESSQLLKCTISMSYSRYILKRNGSASSSASASSAPQNNIAVQSNNTNTSSAGDFSSRLAGIINNPIAFNSNINFI